MIFCERWRYSDFVSVQCGLSICNGVVSVGLHVLLQVWVAGPSGVDVTNILIEAVEVAEDFLTSTKDERQSAALWAPDIHSNVML